MPATDTTATAKAATTPVALGYLIETAQKSGEQMLDYYFQAAKFTLDASSAWMSTLSSLPIVKPATGSGPTAVKATAGKVVSAGFAIVDHAVKVQKELSVQALELIET